MPFKKEPAFQHGQAERTAVLLCNLGTPDEPTAPALRRYLAEFLGDHRVVEIPRPIWWLILHGIILRTRPAKSARKYASIWTPEGSPLKVWTSKQATLLRGWLGERGHLLTVRYAMRYGNPSIASELDQLKAEGATRILIVPLYPQYSGTTTASVFDAVYTWAAQVRHLPELRFVNRYHDDPAYIDALARRVRDHWMKNGQAEQLVMSFGAGQGPLPRDLPVALRQGEMAAALHRADAGGAGTGRREVGAGDLPRLHRRLPGNAGGDRPGGARGLPARGGPEL